MSKNNKKVSGVHIKHLETKIDGASRSLFNLLKDTSRLKDARDLVDMEFTADLEFRFLSSPLDFNEMFNEVVDKMYNISVFNDGQDTEGIKPYLLWQTGRLYICEATLWQVSFYMQIIVETCKIINKADSFFMDAYLYKQDLDKNIQNLINGTEEFESRACNWFNFDKEEEL